MSNRISSLSIEHGLHISYMKPKYVTVQKHAVNESFLVTIPYAIAKAIPIVVMKTKCSYINNYIEKRDDITKRKHNNIKIVRVKEWNHENLALLEHINNSFSLDNYVDDFIEIFNLPQRMLSENSWSLINSLASGIKQKMSSNSWSLGEICDRAISKNRIK